MNSSSHCRTSIFQKKLKCQFIRVEVNIHYWYIKIHFDTSGGWMGGFKNFCQNDMLHSNMNMDVSLNIWRRNTF